MAFKTFVAGDVLTAADVNTYLAKQAVIVCTSGTRPSSPVEGMLIYETDTDDIFLYNGTNWVRIHPTTQILTSGAAVTTSAAAESTIATIVVPAQNFPYLVTIWAQVFKSQTVAGDSFALHIKSTGAIVSTARGLQAQETLTNFTYVVVAGGGSVTITITLQRITGTGTASTFVDAAANFSLIRIEAL